MPTNLQPGGDAVVDSVRPTLRFDEATAVYVPIDFDHEIEIQNANGTVVYQRFPVAGNSHTLESDLTYSDNFWWRVRARVGADVGPWSHFATFRTPDRVGARPSGGGGTLPFPVPPQCGPGGPGDRLACVLAVAALSAEWNGCQSGSGVHCHRFTRQVVYALSQSDPNWKMILAAPGGHACNCSRCGSSDGTMFREDTAVYAGSQVFDMIVGAGGPSPSLSWSRVPGPRSGDTPADAPLCP
jgi:hypothetical protein